MQGRFTGADPIPVTKESFLNPQRWNLYVYVNNNPLGAVDPNGADGQGKAGDKVISVFLDFSLKDLGRRVTTDPVTKKVTKDVPNTTDWQGTASRAPDGYRVEVFGNPDVTGEKGLPQRVTDAAFNNALKNSEVVIYVGHGRGDPGTVPFVQQGIQAGNTLYTPTGTTGAIETAVLPVGTQVSATGANWDFAGDQSAVEIPEPQNTIVVVGASGRVWEVQIFEPGIGGGLRNVAKSTPGVFSRVAQWLGFGKKTAPVKRTIKDIADELGYFPSKAVKDAVSGKGPREAIPSAEREIAAKFYERAAELVSGPKAAEAKALNLQRARFLREGGSPPINIHNFEP